MFPPFPISDIKHPHLLQLAEHLLSIKKALQVSVAYSFLVFFKLGITTFTNPKKVLNSVSKLPGEHWVAISFHDSFPIDGSKADILSP